MGARQFVAAGPAPGYGAFPRHGGLRMTPGNEEGPRLNWRRAALLIGIMSAAGWGLIVLVSGWLLG